MSSHPQGSNPKQQQIRTEQLNGKKSAENVLAKNPSEDVDDISDGIVTLFRKWKNKQAEMQRLKTKIQERDDEIAKKDKEIQRLKTLLDSKIQEKDEEIDVKDEEIQRLNRLLKNSHSREKKLDKHEEVYNDFFKNYYWIEFNLPRKVQQIDKVELWKLFCNVYQTSFLQCREAIHGVFMESLVSLTELTEEEEKDGQINWDRQEQLQNVKAAYQYLLQYCAPKLNVMDHNLIAQKVIGLFNVDEILFPILQKQTIKAVDICCRMQMLSPPMFLCQPKLFNEDWHTLHGGSWYDKTDELVYYRPVLMYTAGGTVAYKGFVGNEPPLEELRIVNEDFSPAVTEDFSPAVNEDFSPAVNEDFSPAVNEDINPAVNKDFNLLKPAVNEDVTNKVFIEHNNSLTPSSDSPSSKQPENTTKAVPVIKEKVKEDVFCPACCCKLGPEINIELTQGFCISCYYINTTCNLCKNQLTPTDTHWYRGKQWHQACLPVQYSCSKYQCTKEPAEQKDMIQHRNFCYHQQCFTCSYCKNNFAGHVSMDGKTLWCVSCYEKLGRHCYFCRKVFQRERKMFIYPKFLGRVICKDCSDKVESMTCFTCGCKIEKGDHIEADIGIHHKSCIICKCQSPIRSGGGNCGRCKKSFT